MGVRGLKKQLKVNNREGCIKRGGDWKVNAPYFFYEKAHIPNLFVLMVNNVTAEEDNKLLGEQKLIEGGLQ